MKMLRNYLIIIGFIMMTIIAVLYYNTGKKVKAASGETQICFQMSANVASRVVKAFTTLYNRPEEIRQESSTGGIIEMVTIPNPITPAVFTRDKIIEYIRNETIKYEVQIAREAAEIARQVAERNAELAAESELIIK